MLAAAIATCLTLYVHDGDSIRCNDVPVRIAAIDAPELRGSPACSRGKRRWHDCDFAAGERSRAALVALIDGRPVHCADVGDGGYGRTAGRCWVGSLDLGCAMIAGGFAVERYGRAGCEGSQFRSRRWRAR